MNVCKRLMDYGFHPPTMYFPKPVHEALMIEPTESETKQSCDNLIYTFKKIYTEARRKRSRMKILSAPHGTPIGSLDGTKAARSPVLTWEEPEAEAA